MKRLNDVNQLIGQVSQLGIKFVSIQHIFLFGSQVRRRTPTSDVDILVILSDENQRLDIFRELCQLTLLHHILIHPIVLTTHEFNIRKGSRLFDENIVSLSQHLFWRRPTSPNTFKRSNSRDK